MTTRDAALTDVHGDLHALTRVLGVIERARPDEIWCLGNIVGLGADAPAAVVELVRQRCTLVLAGNHDCWVTGRLPLDMLSLPRQRARLYWQRTQLSDEQLAWLAGLKTRAAPRHRAMARERATSGHPAGAPVTPTPATYRWLELDFGAQRAEWHKETP